VGGVRIQKSRESCGKAKKREAGSLPFAREAKAEIVEAPSKKSLETTFNPGKGRKERGNRRGVSALKNFGKKRGKRVLDLEAALANM